jgi:hypothetical protein
MRSTPSSPIEIRAKGQPVATTPNAVGTERRTPVNVCWVTTLIDGSGQQGDEHGSPTGLDGSLGILLLGLRVADGDHEFPHVTHFPVLAEPHALVAVEDYSDEGYSPSGTAFSVHIAASGYASRMTCPQRLGALLLIIGYLGVVGGTVAWGFRRGRRS